MDRFSAGAPYVCRYLGRMQVCTILIIEKCLILCMLVTGELNVSFIETVILSVPDDQRTLEHIQPLWSALEDLVAQQRIYSLGISDLSKVQLEELFNWATVWHEPVNNCAVLLS